MEDKQTAERLIEGLQNLYTKLTGKPSHFEKRKDKEKKEDMEKKEEKDTKEETKEDKDKNEEEDEGSALKEIFAQRQKEWKEARLHRNSRNALLSIPRVVMLKYLLPYFDVNEICGLCGVCLYFRSLIKNTIFLHYYVSLHQKTGVALHFSDMLSPSRLDPVQKPRSTHRLVEDSEKEDIEAKLGALQTMKGFLTGQLKERKERIGQLRAEIHDLRTQVEGEKGTKDKALAKIAQLEADISEHKKTAHATQIKLQSHIDELTTDVSLQLSLIAR